MSNILPPLTPRGISPQGKQQKAASSFVRGRGETWEKNGIESGFVGLSGKMTGKSIGSDIRDFTAISQAQDFKIPKTPLERILASMAPEDFFFMNCAIQLFPLKFREPEAEDKFRRFIGLTLRPRMIILSILGTSATLFLLAGFGTLLLLDIFHLPRQVDGILFVACQSFAVLSSFFVGCAPFIPKLQDNLEITLHVSFALLFAVLSICFFVTSIDLHLLGSVAGSLLVKLWSDTCLFLLGAFAILIYCCVIQSRTRYSMYLTIVVAVILVVLYIVQAQAASLSTRRCVTYLEERICEPPIGVFLALMTILQSVNFVSFSGFGFAARYNNELFERITFYRWLQGEARIKQLQQKKTLQKKNGTTPIEDIIQFIEGSVQLVTESGLSEDKAALKEALKLLNSSLRMLSKADQLFAIKLAKRQTRKSLSTKIEADDFEERFYGIYANVTTDAEPVETQPQLSPPSPSVKDGIQGDGVREHQKRRQSVPPAQSLLVNAPRSVKTQLENSLENVEETFVHLNPVVLQQLEGRIGCDWSLNIPLIAEGTSNILLHVGTALLSKTHCFMTPDDSNTMVRFIATIENLYLPNPYHNRLHGAMVSHASMVIADMLNLFTHSSLEPHYGVNSVVLTVAAVCHDVGHPGRNNAFFTNCLDTIAILYNDQSVLENFHTCITFEVLMRPETRILPHLSAAEFRTVRQRMIELILATDMGHHFDSISKFRVRRRSPEFDYFHDVEDFWQVARMCIKAADLSHSMVDWHQHVEWSLKVAEEFYQQGAHEANMCLPISPLCDRETHGDFAKSQKGFIEFVVQPLMKELEELEPGESVSFECVRPLIYNKFKWEEMAAAKQTIPIAAALQSTQTMSISPGTLLRIEVFKTIHSSSAPIIIPQEAQLVLAKTRGEQQGFASDQNGSLEISERETFDKDEFHRSGEDAMQGHESFGPVTERAGSEQVSQLSRQWDKEEEEGESIETSTSSKTRKLAAGVIPPLQEQDYITEPKDEIGETREGHVTLADGAVVSPSQAQRDLESSSDSVFSDTSSTGSNKNLMKLYTDVDSDKGSKETPNTPLQAFECYVKDP